MLPRFHDLSRRAKFRLTGADRVRFLNGQTTNDVRLASLARAQESCVLNAKGHLDAHLFLFAPDDAIWLDAAAPLRASLHSRLDRYIIADDVTVTDETEAFALFHLFSPERPRISDASFCLENARLTSNGWDVWVPTERADECRQKLSVSYASMNEDEWETRRIELGRPRWERELTSDILPPEANLEERAIDYEKGCYIGQEVISRMKMSGQRSKRLCGLLSEPEAAIETGKKLATAEGKEVGWVTSATFSDTLGRNVALGYVKRGFNEVGAALHVPPAGTLLWVTAVPFQSNLKG